MHSVYPPRRRYRPENETAYVSVEPAAEPVTLAEAKAQCSGIETSDDDTLLAARIIAARQRIEKSTGLSLITQTRVYKIDRFPPYADQYVELPGGKVQSVSSVQYVDEDGATQTLATSEYSTDLNANPGRLFRSYDGEWPSVREWDLPVTITYVAGWPGDGASPEDLAANVPQPLKLAILLLVSHWYEFREPVMVGQSVADLPHSVRDLVSPYKLRWVA